MSISTLSIDIQRTAHSRLAEVDVNNVPFGKVFSDHMYAADFDGNSWGNLQILPYGDLPLSPASSMIHYGQSIFEGMKAYRSDSGEILLFRPLDNHRRLNVSADRMAMATVPESIFMDGLCELIKMDRNWIPDKDGSSLYIRPFLFATDDYIGVKASDNYKFMIITTPVGPYYNHPLKVLVERTFFRAVPGGVGFVKASGNYGRSLYPTQLAKQKGYDQLIWTDGREHKYVEESGTMNLMFVIGDKLVTPALRDTILAGITRDSVLTLARDWGMDVEERPIDVNEVYEAIKNGTLREAFGTGTAATIAHISHIGFEDMQFELPAVEEREFSNKVNAELDAIRRGRAEDKHGWVYRIK